MVFKDQSHAERQTFRASGSDGIPICCSADQSMAVLFRRSPESEVICGPAFVPTLFPAIQLDIDCFVLSLNWTEGIG